MVLVQICARVITEEKSNTTIISSKLKGYKDKNPIYVSNTIKITQILAEGFAYSLIFGGVSFWTNFVAKNKIFKHQVNEQY